MKSVVLGLAGLAFASVVEAGSITWNSPTAINRFDPSQVLNTGTFVMASSVRGGTLNGVIFPTDLATLTANENAATGPFAPFDTAYSTLLCEGLYRATGAFATTTFGGLTNGASYVIQVFEPFWNNDFPTRLTSGANNVDMGNTGTAPTYVLGSFTADGPTQAFDWRASSGSAYGLLGAFQVRTVPEPATLGLLGLSGLMLARRRRTCPRRFLLN